MRADPGGEPEHVLVLTTLGAPQRRMLKGRRGNEVEEGAPEPVPTSRATLIEPAPRAGGAEWLDAMRRDADAAAARIDQAARALNHALHSHRVSRADPYARDVAADSALVIRMGYGSGDEVAEGRYERAWELPREGRRVRRSMEAPEERFAALIGGRESVLACEELVLRARADLDAGRVREAALQTRVALESLLAEMGEIPGGRRPALEADRASAGAAANAALEGGLDPDLADWLAECVGRMESALRARRLENIA